MDAQDQLLVVNWRTENEDDEENHGPRWHVGVREKLVIGALEAAFKEMVSGIFSAIKILKFFFILISLFILITNFDVKKEFVFIAKRKCVLGVT